MIKFDNMVLPEKIMLGLLVVIGSAYFFINHQNTTRSQNYTRTIQQMSHQAYANHKKQNFIQEEKFIKYTDQLPMLPIPKKLQRK